MKKILFNFLWVLSLLVFQAHAQNRTVTGTVTGKDDGLPLPGVTVIVKGTTIGTQTNGNGQFTVSVPAGRNTLTVSFIGFASKDVAINGQSKLSVSLESTQTNLNEIVVVGYGTQERRELTGSVGKVQGSAIADLPAPSFDKSLAGRVTGVRVTESSGILGAAPTIRVRGVNSVSSGTSPLYVVDGVPIITGNQSGVTPTNPLGDINAADIQSVEVLKDGAASAIYGSRAANGVVLITTKRGKTGRQTVNYDMFVGSASTSKRLSVLGAQDFVTIQNEKFVNSGVTSNPAVLTLDPNGQPYNTNWQDVVFRKGFQQSHNLSVSGGNETSNYFFSGGFADFTGDIVANSQRKYTVRGAVEQKALNVFTFGFNTSLAYTLNKGLNTGTNSLSGNVTNALLVFPNVPVFNPDGSYNLSADNQRLGRGSNLREIDNNYTNIKYVLDHNIFQTQNLTVNGTAFIDAKIISGLNVRSQIGINSLYGEDYQYLDPLHGDGRGSSGLGFQQYIPSFNYVWTNTASYNKIFGDHKLQIVGGTEFQKTRQRSFFAQGTGISNVYFGPNNLISSTYTTPNIGGDIVESAIRSFFGRVNYSYKDRYLLGVAYRTDYLSSLGPNAKPGTFPGVSLGWRTSEEDFFKNASALKFVNDFKLRASYARTGNSSIGNYPFASQYGPATYGNQSGISFSVLGNPNLRYETVDKLDIGFDLTMLKNRVSVTVDYYKNKDNNLVLNVPIAPSLGVPGNTIAENVGNMYNEGWEFSVNSQNVKTKDFTWSTELNLSFNKNKVTSLVSGQDIIGTYNITRVGQSINSFYGYQSAGVNPANGNPLFKKANGQLIQGAVVGGVGSYYLYDPANPGTLGASTTLSSATDKVVLGNGLPTYFGGFGNTFTYKNFDLNVFFTFSGGNKVYNATAQEDLFNMAFNNNGTAILNRWTTPGQNTDVPKLIYGQGNFINVTGNTISRFLEDGKFIRAQQIRLGYSIPKSTLSGIKLNTVHIYAGIQNAFTITKYKGVDPEISNTGTGVDFNANPRPRTIVVGLNVGF